MHNQQLERIRSYVHIQKRRKSQNKEFLYVDFLITRNLVMENMCGVYCSVALPTLFELTIVIYGVTSNEFDSIANKG